MNVRSQALKRQTKRPCAVTARLKSCPSLNQGRATRLMECARLRSIRSGHRSAPNLPQHRTCLSTEHSSVLPRVNIASQREMSFWNSGDCAESACRNHPTLGRATDANFRIHCLFTVIHCYFWQGKIANSRNP